MVPVAPSITAVSVGIGLKVNTPPVSPVIVAVPPSQVADMVNVESSNGNTVTFCVEVSGQAPAVVYLLLIQYQQILPL